MIRLVTPLLDGRDPAQLDRVVDAIVHSAEAVPLLGQPAARGRASASATALATETAVADIAERMAERTDAAAVPVAAIQRALAAHQLEGGHRLTAGQSAAATSITTSGRGFDVLVGVAGSGKTTVLEAVRSAFEANGYTVLGAATSGQAARAVLTETGVDARTIASLRWRLATGQTTLDDRTVVLLDEAGMTDDSDLLAVLAAANAVGAKAVAIGDHRQLGAVGPGGGLEALIARHNESVHLLEDNVRQHDPEERVALEQLRAGDVDVALRWYARNDRVRTAPTRDDALDAAVDSWFADESAGVETALLAWRRADVADLNERARECWAAAGRLTGRELEVDGRRYAAGDRVVVLAPNHHLGVVTSERGTVTAVDDRGLTARMDDDRLVRFEAETLQRDRLDHAYAITVHRAQGATVERAHVFADGGGRELAYVAMSRAREASHVYAVADDLDQAVEDLTREWTTERRQRWLLDTDVPAAQGSRRRPDLAGRAHPALREARLRAEREALLGMIPPQPVDAVVQHRVAAAWARDELEELRRGNGRYAETTIGEAARRLASAEQRHRQATQFADMPDMSWRARRTWRRTAAASAREADEAQLKWEQEAGRRLRELEVAAAEPGTRSTPKKTSGTRSLAVRRVEARIAGIENELSMIRSHQSQVLTRASAIDRGLGLSL